MTLDSILVLLLFSIICGIVGQVIGGGRMRGSVGATIAVGFIGALFGTAMAALLGLPALLTIQIGLFTFAVIWSILGTALLMAVVKLFTQQTAYRAF